MLMRLRTCCQTLQDHRFPPLRIFNHAEPKKYLLLFRRAADPTLQRGSSKHFNPLSGTGKGNQTYRSPGALSDSAAPDQLYLYSCSGDRQTPQPIWGARPPFRFVIPASVTAAAVTQAIRLHGKECTFPCCSSVVWLPVRTEVITAKVICVDYGKSKSKKSKRKVYTRQKGRKQKIYMIKVIQIWN